MNEKNRKAEEIEQEANASGLIEQDLDEVAGGGTDIGDIDIIVKKKPSGSGSVTPPPPRSTGGM